MILENRKRTYDVLVIPTGETSFGKYDFPVTDKAIEAFNTGKYGCLFVTGGYSGFATKKRSEETSEGKETYDYILGKGVKPEKVYYDDQSLESVGNLTFPIVEPMNGNPSFLDFSNMEIIAQEGHIWRLKDYAKVVMPYRYEDGQIGFSSVPGEHNNGLAAKVYHKALMNALDNHLFENTTSSASVAVKVHDFLLRQHPFYSYKWYEKSPLTRKAQTALVGLDWVTR